jgi:hypothetical protein
VIYYNTNTIPQNSLQAKYFSTVLHPSSSTFDALDAYLAASAIPSIQDPLGYWQAMMSNDDQLAPMSLDYLSTPGESFSL